MTGSTDGSAAATARKRWIAFAAVLAAAMMDLLDATIAGVAAPAIRDDLGGGYADLPWLEGRHPTRARGGGYAALQWLTAAYTLTLAVGLLIGGRLGDLFGRRRMLLAGVAGFTL